MKRRKDQLISLEDVDLPTYDSTDSDSKNIYKKAYQKAYNDAYIKKTKAIKITLSNDEYDRLKGLAKSEKKPLSKLIMDVYYASEGKLYLTTHSDRDILRQLQRIGNNVNQIAAKLNSVKNIFFTTAKKDIRQVRDDVLRLMNDFKSSQSCRK